MADAPERDAETLARLIAPLAGADARPLARRLLARFGNVRRLLTAPAQEVDTALEGRPDISGKIVLLGELVRATLRAQISSAVMFPTPLSVLEYLAFDMAGLRVETLRVLFLDAANRLIADEQMASGTVSSLHFHPREVIRRAIACDASAMILVHNHPGGVPEPTPQDIECTEALAGLAHELGIILHDHLIVAESGWCSMRDAGHV